MGGPLSPGPEGSPPAWGEDSGGEGGRPQGLQGGHRLHSGGGSGGALGGVRGVKGALQSNSCFHHARWQLTWHLEGWMSLAWPMWSTWTFLRWIGGGNSTPPWPSCFSLSTSFHFSPHFGVSFQTHLFPLCTHFLPISFSFPLFSPPLSPPSYSFPSAPLVLSCTSNFQPLFSTFFHHFPP